jgi:parallel beta-helix repeat protein
MEIVGNAGLQAVATAGSGTVGAPYLITDRVINATGTGLDGITIRDTTAYFILQNCTINYVDSYNMGIHLDNVTHGRIEGCTACHNYFGIVLDDSSYNIIVGNVVTDGGVNGILLGSSHYNLLVNNTVNNNIAYGIELYLSDNNTVIGNTASYNQYGIDLYFADYNNITQNRFSGNTQYGIHLSDAHFNNVTQNTLFNNAQCIVEDEFCTGNTISGNHCTQSSPDIYLLIGGTVGAVVVVGAVWIIHHRRSSPPRAIKHLKKTKNYSPPAIITFPSNQTTEEDKQTKNHYA